MTTIIKYTFKEMLKKKALFITIILTVVYLGIYGFGLYETFKGYGNFNPNPFIKLTMSSSLISAGLYFASFIVAFLVVLSSVSSISGEIETGTIYAVLVKPIKRYELVLGKFIGIGIMIIIYSILFFFIILGLNKIFGASMTFGTMSLIKSSLLFALIPIVLLSISILGSSITTTINTGIIVVMLYGLGMIGGILEQIGALSKVHGLINTGIITSLIMPTDVIFRKITNILFTNSGMNFVGGGIGGLFGASTQPSIWMMIYIVVYIILALYFAAKKLEDRDI